MELYSSQNAQPSFEYRLLQSLQEAIPNKRMLIEMNNPTFSGYIIRIWIEEICHCLEYKIPYSEMVRWLPDASNEYIVIVVEQIKERYYGAK